MKTQYITDDHGKKLAIILPIKIYEKMLDDLEEIEDIRLYEEAKQDDDGERILLSEYIEKRRRENE